MCSSDLTDWKQMAIDLIVDMVVGLGEFWYYAAPKIQGWWESIKGWFDSIDWAGLAQAMIDGLVQGIANGAAAIAQAFSDMIQGGIDAAKAAAGIESPSKVFAEIGLNIGQGLIQGINEIAPSVHESILMLFDVGRNLGSIGSGFANQLKNDVFPQIEATIENRSRTLEGLKNKFATNFGSILGITEGNELDQQRLISAYFSAIHSGNEQMKNEIGRAHV